MVRRQLALPAARALASLAISFEPVMASMGIAIRPDMR